MMQNVSYTSGWATLSVMAVLPIALAKPSAVPMAQPVAEL
jgi:hypothetical protein